MKQAVQILFLFLLLSSCQEKNPSKINLENKIKKEPKKIVEKQKYKSFIETDSTLTDSIFKHFIEVSNKKETDTLVAICNCQKNKKDNTIAIQLTSAIPTKKELENGEKGSRLFMEFNRPGLFHGQMKFITIHLKDSLVEKIEVLSKSTDPDYNGDNFECITVQGYKIKISKFDYSIASNIYGTFELILESNFNYLPNDKIVKGQFACNNWRINSYSDIKNFDIEKYSRTPRNVIQ